ncbi:MAG: hypothetical protein EOO65_02925 [Methanosarcinales archaeon]|nr:MAG: hypothetical protein EOO65_02925 [Methanosarcinales archaeon]
MAHALSLTNLAFLKRVNESDAFRGMLNAAPFVHWQVRVIPAISAGSEEPTASNEAGGIEMTGRRTLADLAALPGRTTDRMLFVRVSLPSDVGSPTIVLPSSGACFALTPQPRPHRTRAHAQSSSMYARMQARTQVQVGAGAKSWQLELRLLCVTH